MKSQPAIACFALLLLFSSASFAAEMLEPAPSLSESLQITAFSVSPQAVPSGGAAAFSITVKSTGSGISAYSAIISVYDSSGKEVHSLPFLNSTIAGGEMQTLSKEWQTAESAPGNYTAIANITESGGRANILITNFEITAMASGTASAPKKKSADSCGSPASCGQRSDCDGNYTEQECAYSSCPEKKYYRVESCAPKKEESALENGICAGYPYLCTSNKSDRSPFYLCLPSVLLMLLLCIYAAWDAFMQRMARGKR